MTFVTDVLKTDLTAALEKVVVTLGYTSLKQEQKDAIKEFVKGHDVFVCLPTGFGKSLCYIILPMLFDTLKGYTSPYSIVLIHVVSPLDAIIADQVKSLTRKGLQAVHVKSSRDIEVMAQI